MDGDEVYDDGHVDYCMILGNEVLLDYHKNHGGYCDMENLDLTHDLLGIHMKLMNMSQTVLVNYGKLVHERLEQC